MQLSEYRVRIGTDTYSLWLSQRGTGQQLLATPFVLAAPSDAVFNDRIRPLMNRPASLATALQREVSSRVIRHANIRNAGTSDIYLMHEVTYESGLYVLHYPMTSDTARRISVNTLYCSSCGEHADMHQGNFCALHLGVGFTRPQVGGAPGLEDLCRFSVELPFWIGLQSDSIYITATEGLRNDREEKATVRTRNHPGGELDTGRVDR